VAQLQRSDAHEQREISSGGGMNRPTLMHEEPFFIASFIASSELYNLI